ncbi:MAG: HDOD domain-containing protein [Sterolibacterium sp.]|nr:HDOD domain-containing protein [Sterolibacterium sp.]MBP9800475.1 HDOD domain-containing protein [Sterolibacterium sp.]
MTPLTLQAVAADLVNLPAVPAVMTELVGYLQGEDIDAKKVAHLITRDPVLSARCVNLANSSVYGLNKRVSTIQDAITVIGQQAVSTMVSSLAVASRVAGMATHDHALKDIWIHSVCTALCARVLARHTRLNPETAFTTGLLHDIGKFVLAARFKEHYAQVLVHQRAEDCRMAKAEKAVLGFTHAEIGAQVADEWKFAPEVGRAVSGHHDPEQHPASTLTSLIHVANALAHVLQFVDDKEDLAPRLSEYALSRLSLEFDDLKAAMATVEEQRGDVKHFMF